MSTTRRAVVIARHGGPEMLEVRAVPAVEPGPDEVRLAVTHVGLNHLDTWVRRGVPGHDFHLPRIPGSDVVGEAEGRRWALAPSWGCGACAACADGRTNRCRRFQIRGETTDGGCAEHVVVPRAHLLPIPDAVSSAEAASLPLALLTAWHMLVARARLRPGERVLVQAGASGVGVMAIQIALDLGCEVHATASTEARRERLGALGATAWPYDAVGARNFDVVVESVGASTWDRSIRALGWGGRLVCCGATSGPQAALDLRVLFFKQLDVLGSTLGTDADLRAAWALVAAGRVRPVVDRVMPMTRLGEAHALLERREAFGKVVMAQDLAGTETV
jgi:NADPH:quinone reductase-like Zn-dependent oxidoreductase